MRAGAVPYWSCGGEVLTRCLDADGRLAARAVGAAEAARLAELYGDGAEGAALRAARVRTEAWRRASGMAAWG
jgi:hypothetical protein